MSSFAVCTPPDVTIPLVEMFDTMLLSREADKREAILFRQGRARFQLPSAGHEAIGAIAYALKVDDVVYPYYRDRSLMLARGVSPLQLALDYFAKAGSSSEGRQMASHFCDRDRNMVSCATPTGLQCLPAAGTAWSLKLSKKRSVVICCLGDASTRQGEFYEAVSFALQESLPIVFVVADNGYGISTKTNNFTPYKIGALAHEHLIKIDGRDPEIVYAAAKKAIDDARNFSRPSVLWIEVDRLMSHTSSDDQRLYRTSEELDALTFRDPIELFGLKLQELSLFTSEDIQLRKQLVALKVCNIYEQAERNQCPDTSQVERHIFSDRIVRRTSIPSMLPESQTMVESVNSTLRSLLESNRKIVLFGEDIADPKGGVFGLTKGLSSAFPDRVFNSPLAEATICGLASGMSLTRDHVPVFELQFIDFVGTAFNQLVNQIATLRWRTAGKYSCPMVIYAPCGAYIGNGGPWHSQTNEAWFAHVPGLKVTMPSTPDDAAEIIAAAACGEDPTLVLLPKNLLFKKQSCRTAEHLHIDQPRYRRIGTDVTILAWGNCVEIALRAADRAQDRRWSVEVLDLPYLNSTDQSIIIKSLLKTGRLIVVHEDIRVCGLGQSLVTDLITKSNIWPIMKAAPQVVARESVHIPFQSELERSVLPQLEDVFSAIQAVMER